MTRGRIVVIDDDEALCAVVREVLVEENFEVVLCDGWREAPSFVARYNPDLILLDVRLGDADWGWEVLDVLMADAETPRIPVIVWSAALDALRRHAPVLSRPGVFMLSKPFDLEALLGTVSEALAVHSFHPRDLGTGHTAARRAGGHSGTDYSTSHEEWLSRSFEAIEYVYFPRGVICQVAALPRA